MRYYETLYIIHPDYEDSRLEELRQLVDEKVKEHRADIVNSYVWGKRKLAYDVDRYRYGTYMILQYSVQTPFVNELNNWMELQTQILAYMTTKLDDAPIIRDDKHEKEAISELEDETKKNVQKTKEMEEA